MKAYSEDCVKSTPTALMVYWESISTIELSFIDLIIAAKVRLLSRDL
jgi:hypothetical protein